MTRKIASLLAVAAISIGAGTSAHATLTFTIGQGNVGLGGYPGPYGNVSITRVDNSTATVTLTALGLFSFGDGNSLALNLAGGGTFSITGASGTTLPGGSFPALTVNGPGGSQVDGWGNFNFRIDNGGNAFTDSLLTLTFTLHTTSGAWTTEAGILTPNASGNSVAGHVFVRNADGSNTGVTGFATVPEPTTMIAGALLLLPFGASTIRFIRNRKS